MPNLQPIVALASRVAMERIVGQLRQHFGNRHWLSATNRYAIDTTNRLKADTTNPQQIVGADLAEYIAASSTLHSLDGWSFLGRAVDATLRGDPDTARHLGYYAELRAAMAILATEGIGVFSDRHFVVEATSQPSKIPSNAGTHKILWELFDEWSTAPKAANLVGRIVTVSGIPLGSWVNYFGVGTGAALQPVARDWLTTWGLDVQQLSQDRDSRNESSYRPTGLRPLSTGSLGAFTAVNDLWRALEPSATGRFEIIDSFLFRTCVETIFTSVSGRQPQAAGKDYRRQVKNMLANANPNSDTRSLKDFLIRRQRRGDPLVLKLARGRDSVMHPNHHLQVISRAALLLRIASGACAGLLTNGGTTLANMSFWWCELGEARGYWERSSRPGDVTDLWADVQQALEQIKSKHSEVPNRATLQRRRQGVSNEIAILGECERIGLWGINV
jgi:hypothetical protein